MRLRILATAVALVAAMAGTAHAQYFNAIYSRDGRDVITVGDSGQVYRSINGGATWMRSVVGARPLRDVAARGLTVVMVGDSGKIWRSTDSGGSWALTVLAGTPSLRSLEWPTASDLWVAGSGGTLYHSGDGGQTWQPQSSGTSQTLRQLRFRDGVNGWAVGDSGVVINTSNGGASWNPVAVPTTKNLLGVDYIGSTVWVTGEHAVALKSTTNGGAWSWQNLRIDSGSDVKVVWMQSADSVYLAGGGGFVRRSIDGGTTWTFLQHDLMGKLTDFYLGGGGGWMVSSATRLIPRTTNLGDTWTNPTGTNKLKTTPKLFDASGTIRGSTLTLNPMDHKTLYMCMGADLYRSRNDGVNWTVVGTIPNCSKVNAFVISPKDTQVMVAAVGAPDRIVRSTNGGVTWTDQTVTMNFGEYGVPLEMHPDKTDTLYFGPDGYISKPGGLLAPLFRSLDFGQTWSAYGDTAMISPCDIAVIPESDSAVIVVGDGITSSGVGKIRRSNNGGLNWAATFAPVSGASEIPTVSVNRLKNTSVFASAWSSGAYKRSIDGGVTWTNVVSTGQTWGNDVAKDDPNVVVMGTYGGNAYVSTDGGSNGSFQFVSLSGSNYSVFARDRGFVLFEQSSGIYRLAVNDTFHLQMGQTLTLNSPNGGEVWEGGSVHDVTWNASNVVLAKIEFRKSPGDPWQTVALVDGVDGSYAWTVPSDSTTTAEVRVSDAWDASPSDVSSGTFTIHVTPPVGVGDDERPIAFALYSNRPNPFTGRTLIRYAIPVRQRVTLDVYDLQGHRVARLVDGEVEPGNYSIPFGSSVAGAGRRLNAGVYFVHIEAGANRASQKILMLN